MKITRSRNLNAKSTPEDGASKPAKANLSLTQQSPFFIYLTLIIHEPTDSVRYRDSAQRTI